MWGVQGLSSRGGDTQKIMSKLPTPSSGHKDGRAKGERRVKSPSPYPPSPQASGRESGQEGPVGAPQWGELPSSEAVDPAPGSPEGTWRESPWECPPPIFFWSPNSKLRWKQKAAAGAWQERGRSWLLVPREGPSCFPAQSPAGDPVPLPDPVPLKHGDQWHCPGAGVPSRAPRRRTPMLRGPR